MRLVEVLTGDAPSAIHWLEELGVEFTRENGGYRLARCGGATRKRLLQVGDRTGHAITKALRDAVEAALERHRSRTSPLAELEQTEHGWRARVGEQTIDAATVVLAAGGRCYRVAQERGELSTNHPGATGEVTQIALDLGARGARPRRAPVPPERRRVAGEDAGLLDPRDDARVRRRAAERRRRGVHGLARPARRRLAGDRRRGRGRPRRRDARRPPGGVPRHDAHLARPTPRSRCRTCCAATAAAGIDPLRRADLHVPRPPLPERRPRDRRRTPRRRSKGCTPAARSPAARTGGTA